ncbi:MAG TPA: RHS repeat-associated core domain-containing protein [Pyrinomonadaceae bacterium]
MTQLVSRKPDASHVWTYVYDASGQRIKRTVDGVTTWSIYGFNGELVSEYPASGVASSPQKEYGYRNGKLLITAEAAAGVQGTENVVWNNALGVTVSSNNLTRTASGDNWDNAGAASTQTLARGDGYFEFTAAQANKYLMCGLNNSDNDRSYAEIDFAIYLQDSGYLSVYQSGTNVYTSGASAYTTGDVFRVAIESGVVKYKKNGTVFYTSAVSPTYPLQADATIYSNGGGLTNAVVSGKLGAAVHWLVADQLGTPRMVFDETGSLASVKRHDYLPFGEELTGGLSGRTVAQGYSGDGVRQQFTSKERDVETGLDYFGARFYQSLQGRFTSPDEPFAGQDEGDPQTWNLYSYTSNSPLNRIDEDGRRWFYKCDPDQGCDVQWVNPNPDGTYTSPGAGYIEFIPTKDQPTLHLYSPDGYKSYRFGEKKDGSPTVKWLWTGKVEDRPEHIIMAVAVVQDIYAILTGAVKSFLEWRAQKAIRDAAASAAERLPNLTGKTRTEARKILEEGGFENKGTTSGGYEKWYHEDGSRVQIRPNGEVVRSGPKITPTGGGPKYRPRIGQDGNPTSSHNTGEKVSGH